MNANRLDTLRIEKVKYRLTRTGKKVSEGILYITLTEIIFLSKDDQEVWIARSLVDSVERGSPSAEGIPLVIRCKNFNRLTFVFMRDRDVTDVITSLAMRCSSIEDLYCFRWLPSEFDSNLTRSQGWSYFDLRTEFLRLGAPNDEWEITDQNEDYKLCETYPKCLFVPKKATRQMIYASSGFRSRGRLPVLTYLHRFNKASIARCAQPLVGFSARCKEDEDLLDVIRATNPDSEYLWVVDTRPRVNAVGNKMAGKGYETPDNYTSMRFKFAAIENIHVMRSSLAKLMDVFSQTNLSISEYVSRVQQSGWLRHVQLLLETGAFIADEVQNGKSVLIHCSDGWDRTAQASAIAQLLLDPYYRTLHGFQMLIEKDFLSFGHKFTDRCGHLDGSSVTSGGSGSSQSNIPPLSTSTTSNPATGAVSFSVGFDNQSAVTLSNAPSSGSSRHEMSPIFLQFLDCVWQLTRQQPTAFQFNERLLTELHEETHSCRFGTFVGNCEKDRNDLRLAERSHSFWGYVQQHISDYTNPLYCRDTEAMTTKRLTFSLHSRDLKVWRNMYCRFDSAVLPRESQLDTADSYIEHNASLELSVRLMEESVTTLCRQLGKSEEVIKRKLAGVVSSQSAFAMSQLFPSSFALPSALPPSSKLASISERRRSDDDDDEDDNIGGDYYEGGEEGDFSSPGSLPTPTNPPESSELMTESGVACNSSADGSNDKDFTNDDARRTSLGNNSNPSKTPSIDLDQGTPTLPSPTAFLESYSNNMPFAIEWQSLRKTTHCRQCRAAFNASERKRHCWHCGHVFCGRCIRPSSCKYPVPVTSAGKSPAFTGGPVSCAQCLRVSSSSAAT